MSKESKNCLKCGATLDVSQDDFEPMACPSCHLLQISPFNSGDLHFEKLLARNPMFYVFRGYDAKHKLFLHIVYLRKDFPDFKWASEAAAEQATELTKLSHINICPIFNHGQLNGSYYVCSPRLDGYRMSSYNPETHGLMDVTRILEVLHAVALGLAMAHYETYTHHNICPENIHVDSRGIVRINNFFNSRMMYYFDQRRMKSEKKIFISVPPYFISPEKAESGVEDHRGDVFSFGVLMYYLLTGTYPFQGKEDMDTIYSRVKRKKSSESESGGFDYIPPVPPGKRRQGIPEDLSILVMSLLSYYPNSRPSFPEILTAFNMLRAKSDVAKIRHIQEEIVDSETREIPKMAPPRKFTSNDG